MATPEGTIALPGALVNTLTALPPATPELRDAGALLPLNDGNGRHQWWRVNADGTAWEQSSIDRSILPDLATTDQVQQVQRDVGQARNTDITFLPTISPNLSLIHI